MKTLLCLAAMVPLTAQSWEAQQSGTEVALRGVSAVSAQAAWASGAKGTFLRTTDGGATWTTRTMPGAADLDFRDVEAVDERTAYLLSSGTGQLSRIYKTTNGGESWLLQHTNLDPKGFLDCIGLWDATHGIVLGDAVDGRFTILTTNDGVSWQRRQGPKANESEAAFAASGTCLFTRGTREAWFGTGGAGGGRVFHSVDGGDTWSTSKTPVRSDSGNAGVFSVFFANARDGVVVGGDYTKAAELASNAAVTNDGGKTWKATAVPPAGYRSAVAYSADRKLWFATGTSGSDVSADGLTWRAMDGGGFNAFSFAGGTGWAVGPKGAIAKLK